MRLIAILSLLIIASCARVDYENAPIGTFEGTALVVWVGAGDDTSSGDGKFVYVPLEGNALKFTRSSEAGASDGNDVIEPGAFYTDGGSIPRAVQWVQGFNAWAFGPAYIVHDWLFVVRKCANDGDPFGVESPIASMSFGESAKIMAETIRTVTYQYDLNQKTGAAGAVIAPVTAGPISYNLWRQKGACNNPEEDERIQEIVARVNRQERQGVLPRATDFDFDINQAPSLDGQPPLLVVAEIGIPSRARPQQ